MLNDGQGSLAAPDAGGENGVAVNIRGTEVCGSSSRGSHLQVVLVLQNNFMFSSSLNYFLFNGVLQKKDLSFLVSQTLRSCLYCYVVNVDQLYSHLVK